ncbi:MAG: DUF11 domain-containing protein, partial [Candidatus Electrothrix sp. AR4]|nr:DUF11 domain-containing protein [Candidatus Electrothrix sp. AR4]
MKRNEYIEPFMARFTIRRARFLFCSQMIIVCALLACFFQVDSVCAAPAGYTEYFIPADEDQLFEALDIMSFRDEAAVSYDGGMHSVIALTAWSDSTTVYYDHWEDGYDFDPENPASFPADETFYIRSGCAGATCTTNEIITFENSGVTLPRPTLPVASCDVATPNANLPDSTNVCFYDGRDRIYVAGGTTTVSRAGWIQNRGTVLALSWEVYPVRPSLNSYIMPFGEDLSVNPPAGPGYNDFDRVFAMIQSEEDGSVVTIDHNGDGNPDQLDIDRDGVYDGFSVLLNQGEVFLLSRESINDAASTNTLTTGTSIEGTGSLQVQYIIGEEGSRYEIRGLSAFPREFWDNEYYIPVDSPAAASGFSADAFIYNPHDFPLTVSYTTTTGGGTFVVQPQSVLSYYDGTGQSGASVYLPEDSAVYLSAAAIFWGIVSVDSEGEIHDWAHSLVPASLLTDEDYLAWAPGSYPIGNKDDSGLYISAAQDNITLFIDYRDGRPVQAYPLNRLESLFIYDDVDGDLSQAHIWSTGKYTAAYGQNPETSVENSPAIDVGYTVVSDSDFFNVVLDIDKTVEPATVATAPGQRSTITLEINTFFYPVDEVLIEDLLPTGWSYVAGSAVITLQDGSTVTSGAASPSFSIGNMEANQSVMVTFVAETTQAFADGDITKNEATATGTRTVEGTIQTFVAVDKAFHLFTESSLVVTKVSNVVDSVFPGDTFRYTVEVQNDGASALNDVAIYDALPEGVTYADLPNTSLTLTTPSGAGQNPSVNCTSVTVGEPPNFISGDLNHCYLNPGESLVLSFDVTV